MATHTVAIDQINLASRIDHAIGLFGTNMEYNREAYLEKEFEIGMESSQDQGMGEVLWWKVQSGGWKQRKMKDVRK